jgi:hypothetical protein
MAEVVRKSEVLLADFVIGNISILPLQIRHAFRERPFGEGERK